MSVLCPECARLGRACFNCVQKAFAPRDTEAAKPIRYGIIPCRRCAFFHTFDTDNTGTCRLHSVYQHRSIEAGCGDGLLREEAAPMPPEREPEQEPKP